MVPLAVAGLMRSTRGRCARALPRTLGGRSGRSGLPKDEIDGHKLPYVVRPDLDCVVGRARRACARSNERRSRAASVAGISVGCEIQRLGRSLSTGSGVVAMTSTAEAQASPSGVHTS